METTINKSEVENYQKNVLENFWAIGKSQAESRRSENALFRGNKQSSRLNIICAIEQLKSMGILQSTKGYLDLNHSMMAEIRRILGR
jgi:hypothetical protein